MRAREFTPGDRYQDKNTPENIVEVTACGPRFVKWTHIAGLYPGKKSLSALWFFREFYEKQL
jgi:hypothetical protein